MAHDAGGNNALSSRSKMDIVCVMDTLNTCNLLHRKKALEEVKQASMTVNAHLVIISVMYNSSENIYYSQYYFGQQK